ncbi:bifunctional hydroxymethylpyrimidine kinase/phosphomethylpyrimidine kinase [Rhodospirillaceae bacterium KN72]|uniref:hydroxymethylpyrimidine kinase n=1 Tax=Pacificispira spongiicola TaxID=2729598 RepID=A0A7Y0DX41_9PROT|nr:bifunctional hydroxymethylpyrimidine kinase/phosphomethylpyrimidine kinase [Pacificispira spongiicola]NMM43213.1 bifunctional hydroxymethylpyrimidine kinase/phosphomethylpyrimidine kinase [Pacificispira spongiicola]
MTRHTPIAMTIAGSDSGGGAGIQADLKTFSALGVYGCSVIAALTAQNTRAVTGIFPIDPGFVRQQIDTVFADIAVDAVKIGMLGDVATIRAVRDGLAANSPKWIVLDPVMVAKSGDALLARDAVAALVGDMLPLADIVTPNLPEAAAILDDAEEAAGQDAMEETARRLHAMGPKAVLLKGGHLKGADSSDLLFDGADMVWLPSQRIETKNTHGTGCTLSSAIAAGLAKGLSVRDAVIEAKAYIGRAIAAADTLTIGSGHGPVHHFHAYWPENG